jgi:ArpU family phage transcriptional regulator
MKWTTIAEQRLRDYEKRREALFNIPEQIKMLEEQFTAIRSATTDATPVQGGSDNRREEMLINNIERRKELEFNLKIVIREVALTEKGLKVLTDEERRIIELFYIEKSRNSVERICEELLISPAGFYRRKDEALRKFTIAVYGITGL